MSAGLSWPAVPTACRTRCAGRPPHAFDGDDLLGERRERRQAAVVAGAGGAERSGGGTLRVDVDSQVVVGGVGEQIDPPRPRRTSAWQRLYRPAPLTRGRTS